jgi:hypothetical protein
VSMCRLGNFSIDQMLSVLWAPVWLTELRYAMRYRLRVRGDSSMFLRNVAIVVTFKDCFQEMLSFNVGRVNHSLIGVFHGFHSPTRPLPGLDRYCFLRDASNPSLIHPQVYSST